EKKNIAKNSNRDKLPLYRCIYLDPKGKLGNKPYIQLAHRDRVTFYRETERKNPKEWKKYKKNIQKSQKNIVKQFAKIKKNIKKLFQQVNKEEKKQLVEIVSFLLLQLSYMVKHSAYQEEQECRIFQFAPFDSDKIKKNIDEKRMYMEYQPIHNYVKKIYLSPYAEQYADMFRVLSNGRVEVRSSDNPFR
ncbi:MAG: hypothetical protein IKI11_01730, partial [Neisseriaceae bacterium]|nr:hypothetical protein [Neisseriaceae bacterium]